MADRQRYEIWSEGYSATGELGHAHLVGVVESTSFEDACRALCCAKDYFDSRRLDNLWRSGSEWGSILALNR